MRIVLSPSRRDDFVIAIKAGEVLTLNGDAIDFAALLPGDGVVPDLDADSWAPVHHFVQSAKRLDGELTVTLVLPHGPNPDPDEGWPQPIDSPADGVVIDQPAQTAAKVEAAILELIGTGVTEEALRAAVATGRTKMIADGWTDIRADRQLLGVIREWQTTGKLVST